jgi:glycosyltransferase involved in cell wall biosynthesis|tara:strand:- start:495 stop:1211 length:717 start_codon:yes stop_codon:yes gene_type:complete
MTVSVVIPTLNEVKNIKQILSEMPSIVGEVIFVDGHSKDGTQDVIKETKAKLIVQKSKGFGGAFMEGAKAAKGDIIVMMDADGSHNPADIPKLVDKVKEGHDCAFASRYTMHSYSEDDTILRSFGNWLITKLTNILFNMRTTDSLFMYAAFKKPAYEHLKMKSNGFEFCIEAITKAYIKGLKVAEVPSIERKRFAGETKVNDFRDGYKLIKCIFVWRIKLGRIMAKRRKIRRNARRRK